MDKPETLTSVNLTNRFKSLYVAEENSGALDKNNDATPKIWFQMKNLNHVITYDINWNKDIDPLFVKN